MNWLNRFRILPLLVVVAALSFGVRFGEFVSGVSSVPGAAQAQEEVAEESGELGDAPPALGVEPVVVDEAVGAEAVVIPNIEEGEPIEWRDSGDPLPLFHHGHKHRSLPFQIWDHQLLA